MSDKRGNNPHRMYARKFLPLPIIKTHCLGIKKPIVWMFDKRGNNPHRMYARKFLPLPIIIKLVAPALPIGTVGENSLFDFL